MRHVAEMSAYPARIVAQVAAGDGRVAAGWRQQRRQHLEQGGFARTVGADKAEYLPPGHGKVDVVHGNVCPEGLGEGLHLDEGRALARERTAGICHS